MPGFLALHPGVTLDIAHTDEVIDLLAERTDVAVRAGPLASSRLVARKLGATGMKLVAAPSYLARAGVPTTLEALEGHTRLGLGYARAIEGWPFLVDGHAVRVAPTARVQASDGEALRQLALAGAGLARLATFTIRDDLRAGRLVPLLEAHNPRDREAFHAIYVGQGGPLPARVRALLDFLAARARVR